ncbi:MAG: tetratricopeptide repeat protein [Pseudomonadota bacterium]
MARAVEAGKLIIGAIAVCTDPTGAAAATLGCDTLLQGKAWFERKPDVAKLAAELDTAFARKLAEPRFDKPNDARTLLPQMLERVVLSEQMIVECDLDPDRIFDGFKARLKTDRAEYNSKEMLDAFEALTRPLLEKACRDKRLTDALAPLLHRKQLQYGREARDEARETNARVRELQDIVEKLVSENAALAQELGLQQGLLLGVARAHAENRPSDFASALREVEAALRVAADEKAKGALPANTDDAVNAVLAKVDALNAEGDLRLAAELIAEEESRAQAGLIRLYDKGIAQAVLNRDVEVAVSYELKKLPLEVPEPEVQFEALRSSFIEWCQRGRDMGLNFDLEVSIALARESEARATTADQRGTALNDLGNALWSLGERENGIERLEEAVTAYREALKEYTRDRVPLHWAITQNNLGNVLSTLGTRKSGTDRLEEAVTALREALKEFTRDRVPLDWAITQNNLGNALWRLGERESGTNRLEEAVNAYRQALKERTRDRVPLDWAMTQNNLGNALSTLGASESGTDRLEEAVTAYREALKERTRDRVPLDWAMTQNNLGTALKTLGARESGTYRLEEAVTAFREALKERNRDRVPLNWAATQNNLGNALRELGEREFGTDRLEEAINAYREALKEYTRDRTPLNWAATTYICAYTEAIIAERTVDLEKAKSALPLAKGAQQVLHEGGHEVWAEGAGEVITAIQAIIARLSTPNSKP